MKFPKPGDNVPQIFGQRRLGPVRPRHGLQRARPRCTTSASRRSTTAATSSTPPRRREDEGAVPGGQPERGEIDEDSSFYPFKSYMHVGRRAGESGQRRDPGPVPGTGLHRGQVQRDRTTSSPRGVQEISCKFNMAVYNREQVGSSFKPYILATAVKQGMNVQTSTLDGYNYQYIPPDTQPKAYPTPLRLLPVAGGQRWSATTTQGRTGRTRRSWRWLSRSTPPTPTCGTSWPAGTAVTNNVGAMAQAFGVDTAARRHYRLATICRTSTASRSARRR